MKRGQGLEAEVDGLKGEVATMAAELAEAKVSLQVFPQWIRLPS